VSARPTRSNRLRLCDELPPLARPFPLAVRHPQDPQSDVRECGEGEQLLRDRHGCGSTVRRGDVNAKIASRLVVSDTTVKTHVAHLLQKLDLRDRIQAVVFAYESGIVEPGGGA
jgi:Bacterial regulatory proteins, luxR family